MKIAVIGATGLIGAATVKELAARGHEVIAIARNVEKIAATKNVHPLTADVTAENFADHLKGLDAVVSAFNGGWANPNGATDFKRGAAAITKAVKAADVPYYLIIGGAGSLYIAPNVQLVDTPEFPADIYPMANEARNVITELKDRRDVNWAFMSPPAMFAVKPVRLERSGEYRLGGNEVLFTGNELADITLSDLAVAITDNVEKKAHLFEHFTVAEI